MQATTPTSGQNTNRRIPLHNLCECDPQATNIVTATTQDAQPKTWRNLTPQEARARIAALRISPTIHNIYLNHHPIVIRWVSDREPIAPPPTTHAEPTPTLIETAINAMAHQHHTDDRQAMRLLAEYLTEKTGRTYSLGDIYAWRHQHEPPQLIAGFHLMQFALPYALQIAMTRHTNSLDQLAIAHAMLELPPVTRA